MHSEGQAGPHATLQASFINGMVGAHAILDSISSSIFKGLLMAAFKGLLVDRCITHVLNTDSMPVQTIIQGPIDHSGLFGAVPTK